MVNEKVSIEDNFRRRGLSLELISVLCSLCGVGRGRESVYQFIYLFFDVVWSICKGGMRVFERG